jgi:putative ABC transport system permease protein
VGIFLQDIRYGLRMLAKNPGFAAIAILTLALGIGANSAIFSIVHAVLLRPLPYPHSDRLVVVWEKGDDGLRTNTSYATFVDWRARSRSFDELSVASYSIGTLTGSGQPEQLPALRVSANFFRTLGVRPALGRDFLAEEDTPSTNNVVILTDGLWRRRFNADPGIIGKSITLNGTSYAVVGVLPRDFQPIVSQGLRNIGAELYRVLGYDGSLPWACRTCHHLVAIGRLHSDISISQASAEMDTISQNLWTEHPTDYSASGVIIIPLVEQIVGPVRTALLVLMGAVGLVLLIACANLANMLLALASQRRREIAIREALGAARSRIVRQLLTESFLLALGGAGLGFLIAMWMPGLLSAVAPGTVPRLAEVRPDVPVFVFTLTVALATAFVAEMAPALRLSHEDLQKNLTETGRSTSGAAGGRLREVLVIAEVALTLTLLVGTGLLLRSLERLLGVNPGFDSQNVLTMQISVSGAHYKDDANVRRFYDDLIGRVSALPGVQSVGMTSEVPLTGNRDMYGFHAEGKIQHNPEKDPSAERYAISPDYLKVMRIPLLRGHPFSAADINGTPQVVLINETAAKMFWPHDDPIGKRVKLGGMDHPWWTIIGVVGDIRHDKLDVPANMQVYVPHGQWPFVDSTMSLAIRTAKPSTTLASAVREAVWAIDKDQPVSHIAWLSDLVGTSGETRRFTLMLLGVFAAVAMSLCVLGIYGVVSYAVSLRTREMGIRMALGALPADVGWLVVHHGVLRALMGIVAGIFVSLAMTRLIATLLFGVTPADPLTLAASTLLMLGVATVACYIPARRAMRVDPMVALRYE